MKVKFMSFLIILLNIIMYSGSTITFNNNQLCSNSNKILSNSLFTNSENSNCQRNFTNWRNQSTQNRSTTTATATTAPNILDNVKENEYIIHLSKQMLKFSYIFDASQSPTSSQLCKKHTKMYINGLKKFQLWALQMYDSNGKLTSGILNGNINQFGDFDQCLQVQHPVQNLQGQYCLSYLQPKFLYNSTNLQRIFKLIQSHRAFQNDFNDAGHRVPRFSLINWGLCIPASCQSSDVQYSLNNYIHKFTKNTGLEFDIRVESKMCQIQDHHRTWDLNTKIVIGLFTIIIVITLISTFYDWSTKGDIQNNWLLTFSLIKNCNWLFSTKDTIDDIQVVHGIRFLNAFMLLLSHKSMAVFFNPFINRTFLAESLGQPWTVIGRAASLYTDPFLLFSGMLTSYSLFGKLQNNQKIYIKNEYIGRIIRIVPPLAGLILFCTYILPLWGTGPQWNLVVGHNSDLCKKHWWKNLLFIHNYFGFGDMCLTHTHHLGIDTELFFTAPFMILGLWKWPKNGLYCLISIGVIGTIGRYYTTITYELSNYVYFGTTIQKLFQTADYMYSFPPYRSTVYIMGILLGYILRKSNHILLTKLQLKIGWCLSMICLCITVLGPAPMGHINYQYNAIHAAIYAAFAPIAWCIVFSWIVFVSNLGYKNFLTQIFSWKGFKITTKLSYALYLTQFPVFFYNVGRRRYIDYYDNFITTMFDLNEFLCIITASIILTLLFDVPFQNMKKLMMISKPKRNSQNSTDKTIKN